MQCPECTGSGEIRPVSYRDNASSQENKPAKNPFPWVQIARAIGVIVGTATCLGFVAFIIHLAVEHDRRFDQEQAARADKLGYITAQYAPDGSVVRCWRIRADRDWKKTTNTTSVLIDDLDNPPVPIAESLGIKDVNTCPRFH